MSEKIPRLCLGIFAFICIGLSVHNLKQAESFKIQYLAPPQKIEHFTFGYSEATADIFWIRSLQDFDFCEKKISKNYCSNESWLYNMLEAVTNLSPSFRIPYAAGGLALTVIVSDIDGATKIFEKGIKAFPHDWPILYRAAYHYLYELNDKKRAADLLIQAGQNGAPPWVFNLAGRLYSDAGHIELAESLLQNMIETKQDESLIKRLKEKIASLKIAKK
ncbi:MAG: tetratricopeptide repeat protein [Bdellovibrio sp.]